MTTSLLSHEACLELFAHRFVCCAKLQTNQLYSDISTKEFYLKIDRGIFYVKEKSYRTYNPCALMLDGQKVNYSLFPEFNSERKMTIIPNRIPYRQIERMFNLPPDTLHWAFYAGFTADGLSQNIWIDGERKSDIHALSFDLGKLFGIKYFGKILSYRKDEPFMTNLKKKLYTRYNV